MRNGKRGLTVQALVVAALVSLAACQAWAADPWAVLEGKENAGMGKHIVLIAGD
jgi:hypothetical protein